MGWQSYKLVSQAITLAQTEIFNKLLDEFHIICTDIHCSQRINLSDVSIPCHSVYTHCTYVQTSEACGFSTDLCFRPASITINDMSGSVCIPTSWNTSFNHCTVVYNNMRQDCTSLDSHQSDNYCIFLYGNCRKKIEICHLYTVRR